MPPPRPRHLAVDAIKPVVELNITRVNAEFKNLLGELKLQLKLQHEKTDEKIKDFKASDTALQIVDKLDKLRETLEILLRKTVGIFHHDKVGRRQHGSSFPSARHGNGAPRAAPALRSA